MKETLFKKWWLVTLKGIFITAFGAMLLVNPYVAVDALVLFFGGTLLMTGILNIFFSLSNRPTIYFWKWHLLEGIFEMLLGFGILIFPAITLYSSAILGGVWILMLGVFQLAFGWYYKEKMRGWKLTMGHGILAIFLGIIITIFPMSGVIAFVVIFGFTLLAVGIFFILTSLKMRNHRTQKHQLKY